MLHSLIFHISHPVIGKQGVFTNVFIVKIKDCNDVVFTLFEEEMRLSQLSITADFLLILSLCFLVRTTCNEGILKPANSPLFNCIHN